VAAANTLAAVQDAIARIDRRIQACAEPDSKGFSVLAFDVGVRTSVDRIDVLDVHFAQIVAGAPIAGSSLHCLENEIGSLRQLTTAQNSRVLQAFTGSIRVNVKLREPGD
jgi:uncharacterized protein YegL